MTKPALTKEAVIVALLFTSKVLPSGASLTSDLYFGAERWKLVWPDKIGASFIPKLRPTFQKFHFLHYHFKAGWQNDNTKLFGRQTLIFRERWEAGKRSKLGGRSLDDIMKLGYGPHEIVGVGFVWYGPVYSKRIYEVQTYPYSDSKDFNQAIRTFIQRGLSLNETLHMNSKHMKNLNDQALIAWALVLLGGAGGVASLGAAGGVASRGAPISISEQSIDIVLAVTNHPKNPLTPNTEGLFAVNKTISECVD